MDTQAMSVDSIHYEGIRQSAPTMRVKKIPMINDIMREELKIIINEVLDERERRYEEVDDSWLYRGTY